MAYISGKTPLKKTGFSFDSGYQLKIDYRLRMGAKGFLTSDIGVIPGC